MEKTEIFHIDPQGNVVLPDQPIIFCREMPPVPLSTRERDWNPESAPLALAS